MAAATSWPAIRLAQADLLRRAMGKKDKEKMAKERENFIEGCARTNKIRGEKSERDFRFAGEICGLRIQQVPLRGLWLDQLSDGVSEGELPGRIHGRVAEQRNQQHRQDLRLRRRVQTDGHPDPAAGCEPERTEVYAGNCSRSADRGGVTEPQATGVTDPGYRQSVTGSRRSKTSARARWKRRFANASGAATSLRWRIFAAGSIRASPIAKCWRA